MGCGNSGCSNSTYDTGESFTQIGDLGHLGGWYWLRKNDIDGHWWKSVFKMVDKCSWPPLAQPVDSALWRSVSLQVGRGSAAMPSWPCHMCHGSDQTRGWRWTSRSWLVVWNMTFMTFHILGIMIPTDEIIFFRGVGIHGIPPTRKHVWICVTPFLD